ncbi:MAG: hypothetical protein AAFQ81_08165 [Pseudomonadota bacterium]
MPRTLAVSGVDIAEWPGVAVWRCTTSGDRDITSTWSWSSTPHQHYEVLRLRGGSYWVPVSTNPPRSWRGSSLVVGTTPQGSQPVNPSGNEYRPIGTYIWIPDGSIPGTLTPGITSNTVVCNVPPTYPPADDSSDDTLDTILEPSDMTDHTSVDAMLDLIMSPKASSQDAFQDSDGLISFVNLSSSFVHDNPEFPVGQDVCDQISNFVATLREKTFAAMKSGAIKPLPGDAVPTSQWDLSVTHVMFNLLTESGGLTNFRVTSETYSVTQVIQDFSTSFVKLIFDAALVPEAVITDVTSFIQGVGSSLRVSWDDRSRTYQTVLLGQCHEAVPMDSSGKDFRYFPKIKYYHLNISSHQQEFTTPCSKTKKITFNFKYDYYVTGLAQQVLIKDSPLNKSFTGFLSKAQGVNAKDANNTLDSILDGTTSNGISAPGSTLNAFGVNLAEYPVVEIDNAERVERILNHA